MVGSTNFKTEQEVGKLLASYFDDENTLFCISSDFCHWVYYLNLIYKGSRFSY